MLIWLVSSGCYANSAGNTDISKDTDTNSDTDSNSDGGNSPFLCPVEFVEGCEYPMPGNSNYKPIWLASQFGDGVSFVRQDFNIILAQKTDVDHDGPVVFILDSKNDFDWSTLPSILPDVSFGEFVVEATDNLQLKAIDLLVVGGIDYTANTGLSISDHLDGPTKNLEAAFIALLCDDIGCALYGPVLNDDGIGVMKPMPKGKLPAGWRAEGMFATVENILCVFGDGIKCFDGDSWSDLPAPTNRLNAANCNDYGGKPILAGDNGTVWLKTADGWNQAPVNTTSDLYFVHNSSRFFAVGGNEVLILGTDKYVRECSMPNDKIILTQTEDWAGEGDSGPFYYISIYTESGEIYEVETSATTVSACRHSAPLSSPVLGISESGLVKGNNSIFWFATTQDTIYARDQWWSGE